MSFVDHTSVSYYDSKDELEKDLERDKKLANYYNRSVTHDESGENIWLATSDECKKIWPENGWPPEGTLLYIERISKHPRYNYIRRKIGSGPPNDLQRMFMRKKKIIVRSTGNGFIGTGNRYFSFDAEVMTNDGWIMDDEGPESRAFVFDTMPSSKYKIIYNPNIPYR